MPGLDALIKAFTEHPAAAVAALAVLGFAYIFREYLKSNAAHLSTALSIAPVAAKLAEGVEALERLLESVNRKDRG